MKSSNSSNDELYSSSPSAANEVTRIPSGAEIRHGVVVSSSDIRIDGPFFGTIITKAKVIIGEKAVFNGDIYCENIDVYGTMEGNVNVGEVLSFMQTCDFTGTIKVQRFSVESGAKFEGNCQIFTKDDYQKLVTEALDKINKEYPPVPLKKDD